MCTDKSILRLQYRQIRRNLHLDAVQKINFTQLFEKFLISRDKDSVLAFYLPHNNEIDISELIKISKELGFRVSLPCVQPDKTLYFRLWQNNEQLKFNKYGIREPVLGQCVTPDVIFLPLVAFDKKGVRLGMGGGYYDRTLSNLKLKKSIFTIGLAYQEQYSGINLPKKSHDQALDMVITPEQCYVF